MTPPSGPGRGRKAVAGAVGAALLAAAAWVALRPTPEDGPPQRARGGVGSAPARVAAPGPGAGGEAPQGASTPSAGAAPSESAALSAVSGSVVLRGGKEGLPAVQVRIQRSGESGWIEGTAVATDEKGTFRFDGLEAGTYRLIPGPADTPADERSEVEVGVPGDVPADLVLELERNDGPGAIRVEGTLAFDSGRVPERFTFDFWRFDGARHVRCRVLGREGKFSKRLPYAAEFAATDLAIDGESGIDLFSRHELEDGSRVALVVEEVRQAGVLVVDAASGQPIRGARVHLEDEDDGPIISSLHDHAPPGPRTAAGAPLRTDATGRVSLGEGRGERDVWAIADGYAWSMSEVKFAAGPDALIALVPGGPVRIRVENWLRLQDPRIHAWELVSGTTERNQLARPLQIHGVDPAGEAAIEGLPVGRYAVEVQRGEWFEDGEVYGSALLEVAAGSTSTIVVKTTPPPAAARVQVVLLVAEGWPQAPEHLNFEGLEPGNANVYAFTDVEPTGLPGSFWQVTEPLPPGRYRVELSPLGWNAEVAVPREGGPLKLEVPPPGTIRLLVRDAVTGRPARNPSVHWTANPEDLEPDNQVYPQDAAGSFHWPVPPGNLRVRVSASGLRTRTEEIQATSGAAIERTVVLAASPALTVRFSLDGKPYVGEATAILSPAEKPVGDSRKVLDFMESTQIVHAERGTASFTDFEPGEWELSVSADGMSDVPDRTLSLEAGATLDVEIALERSP